MEQSPGQADYLAGQEIPRILRDAKVYYLKRSECCRHPNADFLLRSVYYNPVWASFTQAVFYRQVFRPKFCLLSVRVDFCFVNICILAFKCIMRKIRVQNHDTPCFFSLKCLWYFYWTYSMPPLEGLWAWNRLSAFWVQCCEADPK
jgi:hypothetical protein